MLHNLRPASGARRPAKRIARGNSGKGGTTAGRGTKGQHARQGKGQRFGFEGGQVPLMMRQPKLGGFTRPRRVTFEAINIEKLETLPAGNYTIADLVAKRLVRRGDAVKLLANGSLSKKVTIEAHAASRAAKDAVKKAGGEVKIVPMQ